jgi:hypothetical protein
MQRPARATLTHDRKTVSVAETIFRRPDVERLTGFGAPISTSSCARAFPLPVKLRACGWLAGERYPAWQAALPTRERVGRRAGAKPDRRRRAAEG